MTNTAVSAWLRPDDAAWLEAEARRQERSVSSLIRLLVTQAREAKAA